MPEDEEVVSTAATAAEEVILSRYGASDVNDLDVTVSFTDGELLVDIYLDAGADTPAEQEREQQVVDDAVLAAQEAADELFAA